MGLLCDAEISLAVVANVDPHIVLATLCPGLLLITALADDGGAVRVGSSDCFHVCHYTYIIGKREGVTVVFYRFFSHSAVPKCLRGKGILTEKNAKKGLLFHPPNTHTHVVSNNLKGLKKKFKGTQNKLRDSGAT